MGAAVLQVWTRSGAAVLLLAVVAALVPATPAEALELRTHSSNRVLGDVTHDHIEISLGSGTSARANVLWFRQDDPEVELRPRLARGTVAGLEQMVPMSRDRSRHGAIAGVNGGYSLPRPTGAPNGLHVTDGRLVAGQSVDNYGSGGEPTGRGMVGLRADGRMVMDRIQVDLHLDQPDTILEPARFDEVNRQVWPESATLHNGELGRPDGELLLYDDRFGAEINVPDDATAVVVEGLDVGTSGRTEGTVVHIHRGMDAQPVPVPADRHVLVAYKQRALVFTDTAPGQRIGITTTITPERTPAEGWEDLVGGVAGGQLLVQDGVARPDSEWIREAAFSTAHATGRQPRTAIGQTADGRGMLVTVDGRRPNWSAGVTVAELADTMIELGAVDAVNLDGGGSTTMTINTRVWNWPSEAGRWISDGLFLHAPLPPTSRPLEAACPDGSVPAGGFEDVPGSIHEAPIDCLAWWGVTQGVGDGRYAPDAGVTREQMASFVVGWIDGASERGDATPLPATDDRPFTDVHDGNVHAESIARLSAAGIINGRTPTTYEPRSVMTRAQTASLLSAAVDHVTGSPLIDGRDTFIDDNASIHEANIDRFAAVGVITGTGGFSFAPDAPVTRGAMAALIMRSSDLVVGLGHTSPPA